VTLLAPPETTHATLEVPPLRSVHDPAALAAVKQTEPFEVSRRTVVDVALRGTASADVALVDEETMAIRRDYVDVEGEAHVRFSEVTGRHSVRVLADGGALDVVVRSGGRSWSLLVIVLLLLALPLVARPRR